ncbi:hypothetical protein ESCO_002587 [Escovopsis weberi]|uniref:Uncharacterized protein n=1 Tax=Escovopsis weberi TaxID=150374 RepID=A0A0N0RT04_ESCWE|nr:hypothetical protein ESCO_002587 [Escovopsis weberi]
MSEPRQKRKNGAAGLDGSAHKKRKAKQAEKIEMGTAIEIGDEGIWVTYARGMKGKAIREFKELCDEVGSPEPIIRGVISTC